jgi:DNA-directed RNA polymerase subunit F
MQVISETPMPLSQIKEAVDSIKKRDKEPNFRVKKMEEYLNSFSALSTVKSRELIEKLTKLNVPRMKEMHIYKIVDLMPSSVEDLKMILQPYALTVNNENLSKILETIKDYVK